MNFTMNNFTWELLSEELGKQRFTYASKCGLKFSAINVTARRLKNEELYIL